MGRIPFTIRLVCFEEGFVQGQEESRQVFRGNRTDLFGDDAFSEGVTSAGIDVEGRFHGVADFFGSAAQAEGSRLLDGTVRRTAREVAFRQEMAVDAAVFQGFCDFSQHAVRVAQALLADGGTDAADRVFEGRRE